MEGLDTPFKEKVILMEISDFFAGFFRVGHIAAVLSLCVGQAAAPFSAKICDL